MEKFVEEGEGQVRHHGNAGPSASSTIGLPPPYTCDSVLRSPFCFLLAFIRAFPVTTHLISWECELGNNINTSGNTSGA